MTILKMTLEQAIQHAKNQADALAGTPCGEQHAQLSGWLTELLAVREAQPVAWQERWSGGEWSWCTKSTFDYMSANPDPIAEVRELFTAPPAPAVPDEKTFEQIAQETDDGIGGYSIRDCVVAAHWWNACRAAMLQSCDAVRDLSTPVDPQIAEYEQALDMVGMSVSVDVSTSDDNAGYRYFGRVTEAQQSANPKDKGGVVLLVQDDVEANFNEVIVPDGYKLVPTESNDAWAERYCELTNKHPDGGLTTYIGDGAVTITFREKSKREIDAMLAAAPTPTHE